MMKTNNALMNTTVLIQDVGLRAAAHLGGRTSDNDADVLKENRGTFGNIMDEVSDNPDPIIEQLTIINGVVRRPVVTGDGFHIGNLAIMHASMGFADNTENAEHEQIHHRQVLMSLHSLHSDDPGYLQSIMD